MFNPGKPSIIRAVSKQLARVKDSQLCGVAQTLRDDLHANDSESRLAAFASAFALANEALRRTIGIELYETQLTAAAALVEGQVAEMETGEGKTFAAAPAAIVGALSGKQVHVATTNAYLAKRDFELLNPAFSILDIQASLLPERGADESEKEVAYAQEVIYGTGYEFGFDYLRSSLKARQGAERQLGQRLLDRLSGITEATTRDSQARYELSIVDEADNVLIDEACSPLILSRQSDEAPIDAGACQMACSLCQSLVAESDYILTPSASVKLTRNGHEKIHSPEVRIPVQQLRRPWTEYVELAIRAQFVFHRDADYIVVDDQVQIVDGSTGRIFTDRSWSGGLHQAIEAKEGVPITNERHVLAQITRQRFYRLYETLSGMTGTAVGCENEFRSVYKTKVASIPRRKQCLRNTLPWKVFKTKQDKLSAIANEVRDLHTESRPVLIGTKTIAESECVAALLDDLGLPYQLLNGRQDADEAEVVAMAGQTGRITIATNLAGRGTDISLSDESRARGGLHVIVAEPHDLYRVDRQLIGRCARGGDPGSTRTFLAAEDCLVQKLAPWLERSISSAARDTHFASNELQNHIRAVQKKVEQQQAARRMEMLKQDLRRDDVLTNER